MQHEAAFKQIRSVFTANIRLGGYVVSLFLLQTSDLEVMWYHCFYCKHQTWRLCGITVFTTNIRLGGYVVSLCFYCKHQTWRLCGITVFTANIRLGGYVVSLFLLQTSDLEVMWYHSVFTANIRLGGYVVSLCFYCKHQTWRLCGIALYTPEIFYNVLASAVHVQ